MALRDKAVRGSLFVKLVSRITVILLILALVVQFTVLSLFEESTRQLLTENHAQTLSHINNNLNLFNTQLVHMISQFDLKSDMRTYLEEPAPDQYTKYRQRREMMNFISGFSALFDAYRVELIVAGQNGEVYTSNSQVLEQTPAELLARPELLVSLADKRRVHYHPDAPGVTRETQEGEVLLITKALHNLYTDKLYGAVIVSVDEGVLYKIYQELTGETVRICIVNSQGLILSDSHRENVGHRQPELYNLAVNQSLPDAKAKMDYNGAEYLVLAREMDFLDGWLLQFVDYGVVNQRARETWGTVFLVTVVFILIAALLSFFTINSITQPVMRLADLMHNVILDQTGERIHLTGCREVEIAGESFNRMLDRIDMYLRRLGEENTARRQAELNSLQMQIHPHFLYNTLTSVRYLALYGKKEEAAQAISSLIFLLRKTISDTAELIPLREELALVEHYMNLQRYRHGDRIHLAVWADPALADCLVPKLMLQPLVENSIFHGFAEGIPAGTVSLYVREVEEEHFLIEIIDNGRGIPPGMIPSLLRREAQPHPDKFFGIGLKNVDERIKLVYGAAYGLEIISEPDMGTQVSIRLPVRRAEPDGGEAG